MPLGVRLSSTPWPRRFPKAGSGLSPGTCRSTFWALQMGQTILHRIIFASLDIPTSSHLRRQQDATSIRSRLISCHARTCSACLIRDCFPVSRLARRKSLQLLAKRYLVEDGYILFYPIEGCLISQIRGVVAERLNDPFADGVSES